MVITHVGDGCRCLVCDPLAGSAHFLIRRRIMAQQPLAEAHDSDIDRSDDWAPEGTIQDEFRAAAADIQSQHVPHSGRKTGANTEQGAACLLVAREYFNLESGLALHRTEKFVTIACVTDGAGRDGPDGVNLIALD